VRFSSGPFFVCAIGLVGNRFSGVDRLALLSSCLLSSCLRASRLSRRGPQGGFSQRPYGVSAKLDFGNSVAGHRARKPDAVEGRSPSLAGPQASTSTAHDRGTGLGALLRFSVFSRFPVLLVDRRSLGPPSRRPLKRTSKRRASKSTERYDINGCVPSLEFPPPTNFSAYKLQA
jgi:hypothetical protein